MPIPFHSMESFLCKFGRHKQQLFHFSKALRAVVVCIPSGSEIIITIIVSSIQLKRVRGPHYTGYSENHATVSMYDIFIFSTVQKCVQKRRLHKGSIEEDSSRGWSKEDSSRGSSEEDSSRGSSEEDSQRWLSDEDS